MLSLYELVTSIYLDCVMFGQSSLDNGMKLMILLKEFGFLFIKNTNALSRTSQPLSQNRPRKPRNLLGGSLGELKNLRIVERHWEIVGLSF